GLSVFDHEVAALDVTEITQSLTEGLEQVGIIAKAGRHVAYSSDLGRLLGLGGERRGKECSGDDEEVPALNAIHASPHHTRIAESLRFNDYCGSIAPP